MVLKVTERERERERDRVQESVQRLEDGIGQSSVRILAGEERIFLIPALRPTQTPI